MRYLWDDRYRRLEEGEVVKAGDEVDACRDGWRDPPKWEPVKEHMIGRVASNPNYPSHSVFRRLKSE